MNPSRTFRIFVSSTFSDLKAERNALQERVFPRLREICESHNCRFQVVDLRWGISESAARDQQTMKICLAEISRCQRITPRPNFIVLLGNRYGWRPLPDEIPADEYLCIYPHLTHEERKLADTWYLRDDNASPSVYTLAPRNENFEASECWAPLETRLLQALRSASIAAQLQGVANEKYLCSATEQEILEGALRAEAAEEHVF
ncbi:DUF4062 domain-containing protein, partial [bacterium]|nr:DUF4062 domain-containing protein [bacterium]